MAQSALTVTNPNPTPPTNLVFLGATPPVDVLQAIADDGIALATPNSTSSAAANGNTWNEPSLSRVVFATKTAAAGSGSSTDHEGRGTETLVTAAVPNPSPFGQLQSMSCGPVLTPGTLPVPNALHPSTLSGSAVPTLSAASGASNVAGPGTTLLTVTGTNYNRGSIVTLNGIPQQTNYVSATSLTVTNALKKQSAGAGTLPVTVTSNGITTAPVNWTFT
jgi:hypothetical protein